jgi:CheY-like chemotaxis protein
VALVLAIEPDPRQASILKRVVRERARAEIVVVDSKDAALAAIAARVPDLILFTALLSPRDEEELVARLRGLEGAEHLQLITIPLLATAGAGGGRRRGGLLGKLRRKDGDEPVGGCDPWQFADQVGGYLKTAAEEKARRLEARALERERAERAARAAREAAAPAATMPAEGLPPEIAAESAASAEIAGRIPVDAGEPRKAAPAPLPERPWSTAEPPAAAAESEEPAGGWDAPALGARAAPVDALSVADVDLSAAPAAATPTETPADAAVEIAREEVDAGERAAPILTLEHEAARGEDPAPGVSAPVEAEAPSEPAAPMFVARTTPSLGIPAATLDELLRREQRQERTGETARSARAGDSTPPRPAIGRPQPGIGIARPIRRLPPLAMWARIEPGEPPQPPPQPPPPAHADDLHALLEGLRVPLPVAAMSYPRRPHLRAVRTA